MAMSPFMEDLRIAIPVIVVSVGCGLSLIAIVGVLIACKRAAGKRAQIERKRDADMEAARRQYANISPATGITMRDNEST
ncbi:hypothetical protein GLAREA_02995 [Glarea lozoyensis ATCC 20868]|uniref:Uncharacterized protein n=1 Tax=Glarea lozoyensis (strain ATCC 20868 / MF5171) TaxID=1116229 RepID=S3D4S3_GLAL2|nr:uncharacterized protein GLAREA_02995 [Glarea lozoyensis ATCC 20868]EPE27081.1 hypothetical protein GLAREA_02995 [Glarea lozoyensis ATCC 20868]